MKKSPLRALTDDERTWLERISRSQREPASHVLRAKQILAVAAGASYVEAARGGVDGPLQRRRVASAPPPA